MHQPWLALCSRKTTEALILGKPAFETFLHPFLSSPLSQRCQFFTFTSGNRLQPDANGWDPRGSHKSHKSHFTSHHLISTESETIRIGDEWRHFQQRPGPQHSSQQQILRPRGAWHMTWSRPREQGTERRLSIQLLASISRYHLPAAGLISWTT